MTRGPFRTASPGGRFWVSPECLLYIYFRYDSCGRHTLDSGYYALMVSLASALHAASSRKKMPAFDQVSVHDLAVKLHIASPISLRDVMGGLNDLPPASITFGSGSLVAGFVHGSGYLYLQSDGGTAFGGSAHESGVVGENFFLAFLLLDVVDAKGQPIAFVHPDILAGQLTIGFSDKNWNDYGLNAFIAANWDAVRTTRVRVVLHASTDGWQVLEAVVIGAFVAAGLAVSGVIIANQVKACEPPNGQWKCGFERPGGPSTPGDPTRSPGAGVDYICRCESN